MSFSVSLDWLNELNSQEVKINFLKNNRFTVIKKNSSSLIGFFKCCLKSFITYFGFSDVSNVQLLAKWGNSRSIQWQVPDQSQTSLLEHFNHFTEKTCDLPHAYRECFQSLVYWSKQLEDLSRMTDPEKQTIVAEKLEKRLVQAVKSLDSGDMLLCPAYGFKDPFYYLFVKTGETYTFKLINCSHDFSHSLKRKEWADLGKTKINSEIAYVGVSDQKIQDGSWLKKLMIDPIMDKIDDPNHIESTISDHITGYKGKNESCLGVKSANPLKGIWAVLKAFPVGQEGEVIGKKTRQRLKLEYSLFTLLLLFDGCHHNLEKDSADYRALDSMLKMVSRQGARLYKKGAIDESELQDLRAELSIVKQTLREASFQKSKVETGKTVKRHLFKDVKLSLQMPLKIPEKEIRSPIESAVSVEHEEDLESVSIPHSFSIVKKELDFDVPIELNANSIQEDLEKIEEERNTTQCKKRELELKKEAIKLKVSLLKKPFEAIYTQSKEVPWLFRTEFILKRSGDCLKRWFEEVGQRESRLLVLRDVDEISYLKKSLEEVCFPLTRAVDHHLNEILEKCKNGESPEIAQSIIFKFLEATPFSPVLWSSRYSKNAHKLAYFQDRHKIIADENCHKLDDTCLWNWIPDEKILGYMEKIQGLEEILLDLDQRKSSPSTLHAMLKLAMMVTFFINSIDFKTKDMKGRVFNMGYWTPLMFADYLETIFKRYEGKKNGDLDSRKSINLFNKFERVGFQIHEEIISLLEDLKRFKNKSVLYTSCTCYEKGASVSAEDEQKIKQLTDKHRMLYKLTGENDTINAFCMPSNMEFWAKKVRHPLLAVALRQIKMDPLGFDKASFFQMIDNYIERDGEVVATTNVDGERVSCSQFEKDIGRLEGLKTQEAFTDKPKEIFEFFFDQFNEEAKHLRSMSNMKDETLPKETLYFEKEELTDLLLLLRGQCPQMEIVPFIKKHPMLLAQADIRNFLEIIFFSPSLIEDIEMFSDFFLSLPAQLQRLIEETKEGEHLARKLFLIDLNQRLGSLYLQGDKIDCPEEFREKFKDLGSKQLAYSQNKLEDLIRMVFEDPAYESYRQRLALDYLFSLLHQDTLSQKDLLNIIYFFNLYRKLSGDPQDVHPIKLDFINRRYALFMEELNGKGAGMFATILDGLLKVDGAFQNVSSPWTGSFPRFQNGLVELNLLTGAQIDLSSDTEYGKLPDQITHDSVFKFYFSDFDLKTQAQIHSTKEGQIYLFKTSSGQPCRVEKRQEGYFYYRTFEGKELQALPMKQLAAQADSDRMEQQTRKIFGGNKTLTKRVKEIFHFFKMWVRWMEGKELSPSSFPSYFLENGIYVDPKKPEEGLCFNDSGQLLFRLALSQGEDGFEIRSVIDCRSGSSSKEPFEVQAIESLNDSSLNALKKFEDKDHVIVWRHKGSIQKVELPRYGMAFKLEQNQLVCLDPRFEGYVVDLTASVEERKGYEFSLLLRYRNGDRPKRLILPPANAVQFVAGSAQQRKQAMIIRYLKYVQMFFRNLIQGKLPKIPNQVLNLQIKTSNAYLEPTVCTFLPQTDELIPDRENKVDGYFELLSHAIKLGKEPLAVSMFKKCTHFLGELNREHLKSLTHFLNGRHRGSGIEYAFKIKLRLQLIGLAKVDGRFDRSYCNRQEDRVTEEVKQYLQLARPSISDGQLSQDEITELAKLMLTKDKQYYELHMRPFFREADEAYVFPEIKEDCLCLELQNEKETIFDQRLEECYESLLEKKEDQEITIKRLEEELKVEERLRHSELGSFLPYLEEGISLLFSEQSLSPFFKSDPVILPKVTLPKPERSLSPCENVAWKELSSDMETYRSRVNKRVNHILTPERAKGLKKEINDKIDYFERKVAREEEKIGRLMERARCPLEDLEMMGEGKVTATLQQLKIAFYKNNLKNLQKEGAIPSNVNLGTLKSTLINYFDAHVRLQLAQMSQDTLSELESNHTLSESDRQVLTNTLYTFLTKKRHYYVNQDPLLLFYEAFRKLTYRFINEDIHQLQFLGKLLEQPTGIATAITGAGKTVTKLLEAVMKANGKNLVTMRFLDPLYDQSLVLFQDILEDGFDAFIYPFRFNLKMALKKTIYTEEKGAEEVSIFKDIYEKMLKVIQKKGCIVTDYKSIPLLAEKWLKLNREFLFFQKEGQAIDALDQQHWTYLRKILILLRNKEVSSMDEYDRPNHPKRRLQIQIGDLEKPNPSIWTRCLEVYNLLAEDQELKLQENLQGDLPDLVREQALHRVATKLAQQWGEFHNIDQEVLVDYFLGNSEDLLKIIDQKDLSSEGCDALALYKDLFTLYLPLALKKSSKSDYDRSEDGMRAVPSHEGVKQLNSHFGAVIEEYIYLIQDFIQNGVFASQIESWIKELEKQDKLDRIHQLNKEEQTSGEGAFKAIFPHYSLSNRPSIEVLQHEINSSKKRVQHFLKRDLDEIKVSSSTISFNPHNIVSCSRAVSGCSATKLGGIHRQFKSSSLDGKGTLGEMVYRLVNRTGTQKHPLSYDPRDPLSMIEEEPESICSVIDGGGAFKEVDSQEVAEKFMACNRKKVERVGFHNKKGTLEFIGKKDATRQHSGFIYGQAFARGFDYPLPKEGRALLTYSGKATLQELLQQDGRLREPGQKVRLAISKHCPFNSTESVIVQSLLDEANQAAQAYYQSKQQELQDIIQADAFEQMLAFENCADAAKKLETFESLFIYTPDQTYTEPGSYFEKHQHISTIEVSTKSALNELKNQMIEKAASAGLNKGVETLKKMEYSDTILEKMPAKTFKFDSTSILGLECETEQETSVETEQEMFTEIETEQLIQENKELPLYPMWQPVTSYIPLRRIQRDFDHRLHFTNNFLPVDRTDSLFKRTPFDSKMSRLGMVLVTINLGGIGILKNIPGMNIQEAVLQEVTLLDSIDSIQLGLRQGFTYDTRTNQVVRIYGANSILKEEKLSYESELGRVDCIKSKIIENLISSVTFAKLMAQAKFFDGQYHQYQYTPEEWRQLQAFIEKKPRKMERFFIKEVLKNRYKDCAFFEASALKQLFKNALLKSDDERSLNFSDELFTAIQKN